MVRKFIRASLFCALGAMAMVLAFGSAVTTAQDKKDKGDKKTDKPTYDIHDIMHKLHSKKEGSFAKLQGAVKGMKWEDASPLAKEAATYSAELPKNDPPRGKKDSWEKIATKYHDGMKALAEGVEKKDAKASGTALGTVTGVCKMCHDNHKAK